MDNKMKDRNCVDKYRSKRKITRRRFHGYKAEKVTTTTTQSDRCACKMARNLSLSSGKKQRNDLL